jgi:hypothetical protein
MNGLITEGVLFPAEWKVRRRAGLRPEFLTSPKVRQILRERRMLSAGQVNNASSAEFNSLETNRINLSGVLTKYPRPEKNKRCVIQLATRIQR